VADRKFTALADLVPVYLAVACAPSTLSTPPNLSYPFPMTKLLQQALEAVSRLSSESQDEIARAILRLARSGDEPEAVAPAHLAAVLEGLAQSQRHAYASDTEVEAAFRRFDS